MTGKCRKDNACTILTCHPERMFNQLKTLQSPGAPIRHKRIFFVIE